MASNLKNLSKYKKTKLDIQGARVGIVVSEWNEEITDALLEGALKTLLENGIEEEDVFVKYVPGTYELALGAQYMLQSLFVDAVICLGCVIQGETRHFDFICNASSNAISTVGLNANTPVIFGVLTTENQEQAKDRAGGKLGNKGVEGAMTALKMISLAADLEIDNLDFDDDDSFFDDDDSFFDLLDDDLDVVMGEA